ncbi:hypothetical protein [Crenobacter cavernae]|uniref:hypothetical protein n=1 Tax=Crenobacter cavernae TaxID=2290923 RepID=UPI0011C077C4|nr:hypothetical protein [Crenobacter cavernae]
MGRSIYLFMWGYQHSYRLHVQHLARDVLKELGAAGNADVLLVGARRPGSNNRNQVCIEPEDGKWSLPLFDGLLDAIESTYESHHLQNVFFGDEPSMRDKPEWMRRDSVRTSVAKTFESYDKNHGVTSFCGEPRYIEDYYVTPVVQIPNATFVQFPPLPPRPVSIRERGYGFRSLLHAAMYAVLQEATEEMQNPEPGRFLQRGMRSAEEIVRVAARNFLHTPGLSIDRRYNYSDLFGALNLVSSLLYEGAKGTGRLVLVNPENEAVDFLVKFAEPVPLHDPRWARKVLQMAASGSGIIGLSRTQWTVS